MGTDLFDFDIRTPFNHCQLEHVYIVLSSALHGSFQQILIPSLKLKT